MSESEAMAQMELELKALRQYNLDQDREILQQDQRIKRLETALKQLQERLDAERDTVASPLSEPPPPHY